MEWVSAKENIEHAIKTKLKTFTSISYKVNQMLDGKIIRTYNSINEIERINGYSSSNICKVLKGKMKHAYGYEWCYTQWKR